MSIHSKNKNWDERYARAQGGLFGEEPNDYLRMVCARSEFAPRSALLPADGDGRNGTWLAKRGIAVTAFDLSAVATRRACERDARAGVSVERFTADLTQWQREPGRTWDAACIFYLHGPAALRRAALDTARAALGPGGWLVLEAFARGGSMLVGSAEPASRYDLGEIEEWAAGLQIVELMSGLCLLDEGRRHAGPATVVRLLARVPGS